MYKLAIPTNNLLTMSKLFSNMKILELNGSGEGKSSSQSVPTRYGHKELRITTRIHIDQCIKGSNNALDFNQIAIDSFKINQMKSVHIRHLKYYDELAGSSPIPLELNFQKYTPHRTIYRKKLTDKEDAYPDSELYLLVEKYKDSKLDRSSLLLLEDINGDSNSKHMANKETMYSLRLPKMALLKSTSHGWEMYDSSVEK